MKQKNNNSSSGIDQLQSQEGVYTNTRNTVSTFLVVIAFFLSSFSAHLMAQTLPVLPLDFESATINYTFTDFDGGGTTKIANPHSGGINTSANVAKMIKSAGQVWAGSWISMAAPIDFSVNKIFKVKVYMPRIGAKILLKVENASNPAISYEKEVTGTVANAWEELTFDYSAINVAQAYQHIIFIFDNGTMGDGTANFTYFFDDVKLTTGGTPQLIQMNLPVTFDLPTVNYGLVGFGGAEGSTIVTDPTLATNKCAKVIKTATAETWAGTTVTALNGTVQTGFSSNIPFTTTEKKMNVRVWSPNTGIKVRLKVEDYLDPTKTCETEAVSTVANAWETLTFDFGNPAAGTSTLNLAFNYNKASIFFNFGVSGATAGEKIYYFDDVKFGAGGSPVTNLPVLPLDFESATYDYTFTNFDGGNATKIANTHIGGINTSANVGKMIKSAGQVWGGSWISLATPIDFSVNKVFKVKTYMPRVGAKLLLKVENASNAAINYQVEVAGTVANAWEELSFDYSAIDVTKEYQHLVFIFDLGTAGDSTANFTYFFDDVKLTTGGTQLTQMNLPVTFELPTVNYGLVGFGGAEGSTIVTDPTLVTNKCAKVIKTATAETWAGTTITAVSGTVQTGFSSKVPFTASEKRMNLRVWSPNAGIHIRLKVEDYLDPTKTCETEVVNSVANGWEGLTFDFNTPAPGTGTLNLAYNYNKVSIFFNFGVTGGTAGEKVYYFDDVQFGPYIPIPVEFTAFSAQALGRNINLVWSTATEKNSSEFVIERKSENSNWTAVGVVKAMGTTTAPSSYMFEDKNLVTSKYSYRLKQVDLDGSFSYSKIVEAEIGSPVEFELSQNYPNPFNPSTKISFSLPSDSKVTLDVYDVAGIQVVRLLSSDFKAGFHSVDFDAAKYDISSGIYFYRITAGSNIAVKKMLLLK